MPDTISYTMDFVKESKVESYILTMSSRSYYILARTKAQVDSLVTLVKPLNLHKNVPP